MLFYSKQKIKRLEERIKLLEHSRDKILLLLIKMSEQNDDIWRSYLKTRYGVDLDEEIKKRENNKT
jgi:hypothetical protein